MRKDRTGQSLLETVVALGIITSVLVSIFSLVINNIATERASTSRVQAVNFAREALEATRAMRDSNWVAGRDPWTGIGAGNDQVLAFDETTGVYALQSGQDPALVRTAGGAYAQGSSASGEASSFSRRVDVLDIDCSSLAAEDQTDCAALGLPRIGVRVTAHVQWSNQGRTQEIAFSEDLYDWR